MTASSPRASFGGQTVTVEADSADTDPLVGMGLLQGYRLSIEVVDGGSMQIQRLPE